ncbi:threonine/serine exporter, partial [Turicibacter sanguinis]|nr:threonine/serine exporter [Turicibacter sanguinis]
MKENMILIISATIESLGFALLFRVRKDRLIYGTIGGMVT